MFRSPTSATGPKRVPWLVLNNYRLRASAFFLVFVGLSVEFASRATSALTWLMLFTQFIVYPHVLYWWARRSPAPLKVENRNLILDSFLIGGWVAALQFPIWPTFTLALASTLNSTIMRGKRGFILAAIALCAGMASWLIPFGFRFTPTTGWVTSLFLGVGIAGYVLVIGYVSYLRNEQLRSAREKLRQGERTLHTANEALKEKLTEIQQLQAQLKEQAIRDPLTGLFNRRYLDTIVPHELARCEREGTQLCLMMMDIDHFKRVNDTYGHPGGDAVLKALAQMLIESVRASDVACRYGGEEFLLLLPNMTPDIALLRAEQWRARFESMSVRADGQEIRATVSIGIASYPRDGASVAELTRCADLALYRAKAEGRNRVILCRANDRAAAASAQVVTQEK